VTEPRLLSVLVPAVGGQGGGVLAEWLVEAATGAGLVAHGTSIPGVAQRTGSTTYYVEVYTGPEADAPVFSLYPVPGALDVLLAPEFLEVGRAIELGFCSPGRTTIVASTHRLYSIHEKIATGRALYPSEQLETAARAFSRRLAAFDALAVAREHGTEVNAVLLGALAASEALPIAPDAFRAAIRRKGIQVEANLRGFDVGMTLAQQRPEGRADAPVGRADAPEGRADAPVLPRPEATRPFRQPDAFASQLAGLPEGLRPVVGEALARLVDYQDERYAGRYLDRLAPFVRAGDLELALIVARHLAVWMTYEDAIRVADLKTRRSRFERIRAQTRPRNGEIVVTDYLKPDLDEIYGILPARLVAPFARWAERRWPHGRPSLGQHVRTTTVLGFLRVWLLGRLRRLRPVSYRAQLEHARMERWLQAVHRAVELDPGLARELARLAQLVKGYGDVRRRLTGVFDEVLDGSQRAAALEAKAGQRPEAAAALAARARRLVLQGPDGESQALALARDVVARLEGGDRDGAVSAAR
jgi:indolepyruvate ferredoxin oxidoreductase beta subunit